MKISAFTSKKELFGEKGPTTLREQNLWDEIIAARIAIAIFAPLKIGVGIIIVSCLIKYLFF
jgi:hypothetical protein